MAESSTVIANMALSHLGSGKDIGNLDTERSAEAEACRRFYTESLRTVLRSFPWPFATKTADLVLVSTSPTINWGYGYRYPTDCLMFRQILSGVDRLRTRQNAIAYRIEADTTERLILTDQVSAQGQYTSEVTTVARFPSDFVMAFSLHLASLIAPRVTAGDPFKLGERAMRLWILQYTQAAKNAANEEQPDELPDSEMILGRS